MEDCRRLFIWSAVIIGTYAVLVIELLTLARAVTTTYLIIAWAIPLPILSYLLIQHIRKGQKVLLPSLSKPESGVEYGLWIGIFIILFVTAVIAWKTPPQTWDSLNYHMSRVAHWAQQGGLQHFATGIEVQNNMAPGAEILVLHSYVLSASDDWVNFIQWFAMIGSAIGVSWIAYQLGTDRRGQLLAAVFVFTIPMGIAESTSTMTDYVVTFWIVCVAAECVKILRGELSKAGVLILGASVGLAVLSKPTAFAFLLPFAILVAWLLIRKQQRILAVRAILLTIGIALILNLGHFVRNGVTYGNPIGPVDRFSQHANQLRSLRGLTSNLIRNTTMHLQTPSPHVNKAIAIGVELIHQLMGLDVNDPRTTAAGRFKVSLPRTNEILVGNPLHTFLILIMFGIVILRRKKLNINLLIYTGVLAGSAILFSFLFKWLIFGTRLQLPFFVLAAPMFGSIFGVDKKAVSGYLLGFILLLASTPWVFSIDSRPVIPNEDRSLVGSVLNESWMEMLFANAGYLKEPIRDMVIHIAEADCSEAAFMLLGNSVEYPFWAMFGAPRTEMQFSWIVEGTPSSIYSSEDFEPCAIICEDCPFEDDTLHGLRLAHSRAPYSLYLKAVENSP
jgi:4-amino-4-deoxy-L-arabinose transferase-like glycosyltransferase